MLVFRLLQFLPLTVFLYFSQAKTSSGTSDWASAFQWGAVIAIIELAILVIFFRNKMSRMIAAVNLYLFIGGLGFYFQLIQILDLLNLWRETGLLATVTVVMLFSTFATHQGAFETTSNSHELSRKYSLWLVGWCALMTFFSWMNKGQVKLAGVFPFISIIIFKFFLEKRMSRNLNPQKEKLDSIPK